MEKIYGMHKLVGLQLFLSGTPTFSSGTPTFCQMGVLNSCFQNPSESSEMHLKENTLFDLWVKVTLNVAQYSLHYVTYTAAKFKVATSNDVGGDAFTRKYII